MMKSNPKFIRYAARRHSIAMAQTAVAVVLLASPISAQAGQSCTEPAATITSNMFGNACKLRTQIGSLHLDELPIWKTVDVGVYYDANAVRDAARAAPVRINIDSWANQILSRISFRQSDTKLNLVLVAVSDIGFGAPGAKLKDIYERASQFGLALCPAEVGPALRLAYLDQPLGEYLHIAMRPVARSDGNATDFTVAKGLAGWLLIGDDVRDDLVLAGDTRMVFVRPDAARIPESSPASNGG